MNKTRRRQRKHAQARQRQSILCAAAAKSSATSAVCVCVCVCASNRVTPSLSQESGHTRTFNEVWAAYYGASLSQTFKERETLLPCIHSPTLAHMLPIGSRSFLQLLILTIFSKKDNYANLSNSMKMNMRVWEEHRRNSTAFPLMKTVKPTEGFSAGASSESLRSFKN